MWRRGAAIIVALLLVPVLTYAHAALLKSDPKAGSVVAPGIRAIRLEFSEKVISSLSHIAVVDATAQIMDLRVGSDPRNARALIAPVNHLNAGAYRINWHVVSADGHPIAGTFVFSVAGATPPAQRVQQGVIPAPSEIGQQTRQEIVRYPVLAALVRGMGIAALLALSGLLVFALRYARLVPPRLVTVSGFLAFAGAFALVVHLLLWVRFVEPSGPFAGANWAAMLASQPGRMELLRTVLALSALLTLLGFRMLKLSLSFLIAAIFVSAAVGHPTSTHPMLSVPLIAVHLLAIAAWGGGIAWLVILTRSGEIRISDEAHRVSRTAIAAAALVVATGVIESTLLLTAPSDLVETPYGRLLMAKAAGLLILVVFGWSHRYRVLPALASGERHDIPSSFRSELAVMLAVILLAGFLSYMPLPR